MWFFLYASFVIYISMVEIMWVRVNYKVMFIMVEETGRTQDSMI